MICDTCKSLNLSLESFIIQEHEDKNVFEEEYDLGSLQSIREKAGQCELCRLIIQATVGLDTNSSSDESRVQCQLYWQYDGFLWNKNGAEVRCLRIACQPWPPYFHENSRLLPLGDHLPGLGGLFLGRQVKEDYINPKRIKKWMKLCQRWHEDECDELTTSSSWTFPPNFRMIDAWNRCIVQAPPDGKYVILSYVWGKAKAFTLLESNIEELQIKGSLNGVWKDLPRTIQNAITLTSALSFRYIWIDSLCIVQDDSNDKATIIPYMHIIYDRAFMTITAATGNDAQAGLPGIHPSPRCRQQQAARISPDLTLICPEHLTDGLDQSVYDSRAWTYQESRLSRRRLMFIGGIAIFRCRCDIFREDVFLEDFYVQNSYDKPGKYLLVGPSSDMEPHDDYHGSLYEYSSRQLSFETDILNAFEGVLNILSKQINGTRNPEIDHIYGLPTCIFDWALLWQPNQTRNRKSDGSPSWSWCGWRGTKAMALTNFTAADLETWLSNHTWIHWNIYAPDGSFLLQIPSEQTYQHTTPSLHRFPSLEKPPSPAAVASRSKVKSHADLIPSSLPPSSSSPCSHLLHFATLSVHMHLTPIPPEDGASGSETKAEGYILSRPSSFRPLIPDGTIEVGPEWGLGSDLKSTCEFLVIADAPRSMAVRGQFVARKYEPVRGRGDEAGDGSEGRSEEADGKWAAYFIMLIQRSGDCEEIAERVGLGVVYREAVDEVLRDEEGEGKKWRWGETWLR